jgi:glyoxylase-like metal-dependent hydrolase (beta-lactamase superfamily II)/rhodanese-related sulfurtransferase
MHGQSGNPTIKVETLVSALADRQPLTILDVRAQDERAEWAIPGSYHVDAYDALKARDPQALAGVSLPAGIPVVTVCGAGNTSLVAAAQLRARGFDAVSLAGGMNAWSLAWNTADVPLAESAASVIQIRRLGKGCLSYLLGSGDEAVVIDAALDPEVYLDLASQRRRNITHVLDTHIHADHLSRSRSLADKAGATLHLPAQDRVAFPFSAMNEGEEITFGDATLTALSTPGHTMESMTYQLGGHALLTGDTLFLASVGRPDLEASPKQAEVRSRLLYRSLQRLAALPGDLLILPGHTSEPIPFDAQPLARSLAEVRAENEELRLSEDDFTFEVTSRLPPAPANHAAIVALNEAGNLPPGDPAELEAGANRCAVR